ncbi:hypothetical protein TDB9533_02909 [Thalassocella blandensis]|nr:hypothetical protein TDB9533_02909 [Thalassocella blandensis]
MKKLYFRIINAAIMLSASAVYADQVINDDLITSGSLCVGVDCTNGELFSFDTIRLKENNLRLKFMDTSASSAFPSNDWQITINDSSNGGNSYFAVEDVTAGTMPFYVGAGASSHSLYINGNGNIGIGTATPQVDLNLNSGNTPTIRLEQDITGGFSAQSWDVGANEANFFVRDFTNGATLPFRIAPGASDASLFIASDGDIGFKTTSPAGVFDIAHPSDANNHALLIDPSANVGINIDDGFSPQGLFDVQTTGGVSRFRVESNGNVMLSDSWQVSGADAGSFVIQSLANAATKIELKDDGSIVIGDGITVAPSGDVTVTNLTVTGTCTGC